MATVLRRNSLELPHVKLPDVTTLPGNKYRQLVRHHNTLLDGIEIRGWFLEELFTRDILTSRQKRSVDQIEDQRAKAGVILEQVYKGSSATYDNFQQALRTTNQEALADLLQPADATTELSLKSEQDMVVKLQKNKQRLKQEVQNMEEILQIMVREDLISRMDKEKALLRRQEHHLEDVLDLLYTKGLSVMQHFLRILGHQGYEQLAQDIDRTTTDIQVAPSLTSPPIDQDYTLMMQVRAIKITKQQQKYLQDLPNELNSLFRANSGKITKYLASRYKVVVVETEPSPFKVKLKFMRDADLGLLKQDYHNGTLNEAITEKAKTERFIKRSDCRWQMETDLDYEEMGRLVELFNKPAVTEVVQREQDEDSDDSEETDESDSEEESTPQRRPGDIRIQAQYPLTCGCNGDGRCVIPPEREGDPSQEDTVFFNVLITKVKSHSLKGKSKSYNFSALDLFKEIRNPNRQNTAYKKLTDNNGYNILHIVILEGRLDVLLILFYTGVFGQLVEERVTGGSGNLNQMTPMDIARKFRMTKCQDELTRLQRLEASLPIMHKMARNGDEKSVKLLLERHPQMMETRAIDGSTALYWAVVSGSVAVVQQLILAQADLSARTFDGETLVGCAVRFAHKDLVRLLVTTYNMDPEERSAEDKTPITIAIEIRDLDLLRCLTEVGAKVKGFHLPQLVQAGQNNLWTFSLAMFPKLPIDHTDAKGKPALFYACETANRDIYADLIKRNARLDIKDKRGRNLLFAAIDSADLEFFREVLELLKKRDLLALFINEKDLYLGSERCFLVSGRDKGILGYHYLEVHRVYLDIFRSIIRSGGACDVAKYGEVFKSGWGTPPPEVKKEVDMRYDTAYVTPSDTADMTPLHYALVREQMAMALELILRGADINEKDSFDLCPAHLACMRGYLEVLALLEEKKANFNVFEKHNMNAAQVAEANRHYNLEHFFKGSETIKDPNLKKFRAVIREQLKQLDDAELHKERKKGKNIRQVIIWKLRDMTAEINFFLWKLGTSQIQEETEHHHGASMKSKAWSEASMISMTSLGAEGSLGTSHTSQESGLDSMSQESRPLLPSTRPSDTQPGTNFMSEVGKGTM